MEWEVTKVVLGPSEQQTQETNALSRQGRAALRGDVEPDARVHRLVPAPEPQLVPGSQTLGNGS
jgi:hypothetical protein